MIRIPNIFSINPSFNTMDTSFDALLPFLNADGMQQSANIGRSADSDADESTTFLTGFLTDVGAFRNLDEVFDMTPERLERYLTLYKETKSRCKEFTEAQWASFEKVIEAEMCLSVVGGGAEEADTHEDIHDVLHTLLGLPAVAEEEDDPEKVAEDLCREAAALDALAERQT